MRKALIGLLSAAVTLAAPALAQDWRGVGTGRLLTNDLIGDGHDRWRTGSYVVSKVYAREEWNGRRPEGFGEMVELRFRGEIIQPETLGFVDPTDRRYAGVLTFGAHSHFQMRGTEISLGGDLVLVGEDTGLSSLQDVLHDWISAPSPSEAVLDNQLGNKLYGAVAGEMAQPLRFGENHLLRPFIEGRAGEETLVRAGFDYIFGTIGQNELLLRDVSSGQLYRGTRDYDPGTSFVLGADIAKVFDTIYLPDEDGLELTDFRTRARAGFHWQQGNAGLFYGLSYLGKEFETQSEGQFVGSMRLHWAF